MSQPKDLVGPVIMWSSLAIVLEVDTDNHANSTTNHDV